MTPLPPTEEVFTLHLHIRFLLSHLRSRRDGTRLGDLNLSRRQHGDPVTVFVSSGTNRVRPLVLREPSPALTSVKGGWVLPVSLLPTNALFLFSGDPSNVTGHDRPTPGPQAGVQLPHSPTPERRRKGQGDREDNTYGHLPCPSRHKTRT